jgi:hypothetical protein
MTDEVVFVCRRDGIKDLAKRGVDPVVGVRRLNPSK